MFNQPIFHLAFPIANIPQTKEFYGQGLGCTVGRETRNSIILNLYGHQLVGHISDSPITPQQGIYPRHFGIIFPSLENWQVLAERAQHHQLKFLQSAKRRFPGEITEHYTFFLADPFGNFLEFKHYVHSEAVFGARDFKLVGDV
jgi:uncharacterized protein